MDIESVPFTTGGSYVLGRIEYIDVITTTLKKRLNSYLHIKENMDDIFSPVVQIDDNMDGTYNGSFRLYLSGHYRISISLNGQDIAWNPFSLYVTPGEIYGPSCTVWWGKFAKIPGESAIESSAGDAVLFTVSSHDRYGNKCNSVSGHNIAVRIQAIDQLEESKTQSDVEYSYDQSTTGIIPCYFITPKFPGIFNVFIGVDSSTVRDQFVQGSPFQLIVVAKESPLEVALVPGQVHAQENSSIPTVPDLSTSQSSLIDLPAEDSTALIAARRRELTRRRAEEALLKERARRKEELEARRREKSVRRTGGGFIIQYSKDI
jgi:hypothetical protein